MKLRQNLYNALTDINQDLGIQKTGQLQKKNYFFNTTHKLKVYCSCFKLFSLWFAHLDAHLENVKPNLMSV